MWAFCCLNVRFVQQSARRKSPVGSGKRISQLHFRTSTHEQLGSKLHSHQISKVQL